MRRLLSAILILGTLLITTACADLSNADFYDNFPASIAETETINEAVSLSQQTTATIGDETPSAEEEPASAEITSEAETLGKSDITDMTAYSTFDEASASGYGGNENEALVWIPTNGGTKHHMTSTCSKMKDPIQVTKSEALARGFEACKRCYK